jgi:serine/threonine-protein kinase RsbT
MTFAIENDLDIVRARESARELARDLGLSRSAGTVLTAMISELSRNILLYAKRGEIVLAQLERGGRRGIGVVARDRGRGISDVRSALRDGYSTSGRPGLGLSGVRRLADEFQIQSGVGVGTTVTVKTWWGGDTAHA